jgi:aminodeoxyfutalosine synthase
LDKFDFGRTLTNMNFNPRDKLLLTIWEKVRFGRRLSLNDGLVLYNSNDLISLGQMAHFVQYEMSGDAVYFVLNQKIEHTNICVLSCKFCDFAAKKGDPSAYEMTTGEILSTITPEIREVHITGGMPPDWPWDRYLEIVQCIHDKYPEADVKAYTAVEIDFFHKKFRMTIDEVLRQLKSAGVKTLPGGGAEIFSERVRKLLFNQKIGGNTWLEVHKAAHRMGIPSNATMLYGHIETTEERLIHMIRLREMQDETGGFLTFIPLAFQPGNTGIKPRNQFTSAIDDLKTIAISRLMLDNFPHIKAYWVMLTEEVASVALNFGADDLDGTVGQERIAHDAGALSPLKLAKEQIIRIIRDAGKIPVERDALYNPLRVDCENVIGKIPFLNSVPYFYNFEKGMFKLLPVIPRIMGILSRKGQIDAGLFSLVDYYNQEEELDLLPWCIASRDQVKSVMLFSKEGWTGLNNSMIGISAETATSVRLLQLLLEKKYGVNARFERVQGQLADYSRYAAVLLIGDQAMYWNKHGLPGFELVFDLACEWYDWKKMPFVFAVWAVRKSLPEASKKVVATIIGNSLEKSQDHFSEIGEMHGSRLGLTPGEVKEYLEGLNFRLGEREQEAMKEFRKLVRKISVNVR